MEDWYLSESDIFTLLDKEDKNFLLSFSSTKTYKRGQLILSAEDKADSVCYLHSGKVKTYFITKEGFEVTVLINYPHQLFALSAFYANGFRLAFHKAIKESVVRFIPTNIFTELIKRNQKMASAVFEIIGAKMHFVALLAQDLTKDVQSRLANLLLKMSYQNGNRSDYQVRITPNLTHEEIGTMINARRQTVTSVLCVFEREGLIKKNRNQIIIVDLERLKQLT